MYTKSQITLLNMHENEPLGRFTSYAIGGRARFFARVSDVDTLPDIFREIRARGCPYYVLGGGSNTLVGDEGFDGCVVKIEDRSIRVDGTRVVAASGAVLAMVTHESVLHGLSGMEWAFGIPGTVGGAVRGNAGAFGGEIKDILEYAEVYDPASDAITRMEADAFQFRYRWSVLAKQRFVVMRAVFTLTQSTPEACKDRLAEFLTLKKERQPLGAHCAGSVFKNILTVGLNPTRIPQEYKGKDRIHVAWLLDNAGMKGVRRGNAYFSPKHANFIVNDGRASASDVRALIAQAKSAVKEKFGLDIEEEIRYLGNDLTTY